MLHYVRTHFYDSPCILYFNLFINLFSVREYIVFHYVEKVGVSRKHCLWGIYGTEQFIHRHVWYAIDWRYLHCRKWICLKLFLCTSFTELWNKFHLFWNTFVQILGHFGVRCSYLLTSNSLYVTQSCLDWRILIT